MREALSYLHLQSLFLRSQTELQRHIRRQVRCPETAADLTQDLYLRLDRLVDRLPNEDEARRYLFKMATNIARDHHRIQANRTRLLDFAAPLRENPIVDTAALTDLRREALRVWEAIEALPARRRTMLLASRLHGRTYVEIAAAHSVSVSLVEKEIAAAIASLLETPGRPKPMSRSAPRRRRRQKPAASAH